MKNCNILDVCFYRDIYAPNKSTSTSKKMGRKTIHNINIMDNAFAF
jgi:hypothetical protein